MFIVKCDSCTKQFTPNVKVKEIDKKVNERYFTCPYCKEEYHVSYEDKEIKKLQRQYKLLTISTKQSQNKLLLARYQTEMKVIQDKLKQKEISLRNKYESYCR